MKRRGKKGCVGDAHKKKEGLTGVRAVYTQSRFRINECIWLYTLTMLCDPDGCGVGEGEQKERGAIARRGGNSGYLSFFPIPTQPQSFFHFRATWPGVSHKLIETKNWVLICRKWS